MLIDVADLLKCPEDHPETYCVLVPQEMDGRTVVRGTVGCPSCRAEYEIRGGVVCFGNAGPEVRGGDPAVSEDITWDAAVIHALLGLTNPGGHVVLVGAAGRTAPELVQQLEGVHVISVNVPRDTPPSSQLTCIASPHTIPLRSTVARGVVVGPDFLDQEWLRECARILLRGRRLIVVADHVTVPGVRGLATAEDLWVGERVPDVQSS